MAYQPAEKNGIITREIIVGSVATYRGKKFEKNQRTHAWRVYIRSPYLGNDLNFISKVEFYIHESFTPNKFVCVKPPYGIQNFGWGEFSIRIVIYFIDDREPPREIYHLLKLYPPVDQPQSLKKGVISERIVNLEFPLATTTPNLINHLRNDNQNGSQNLLTEQGWIQSIETARQNIENQINIVKTEREKVHDTYNKLKQQLTLMENEYLRGL